jgi:hypothetical protein
MDGIWLLVIGGLAFVTWKQRRETVRMNIKKNLHVSEFGLKPGVWPAFCHLAAARRVSQTKQIGDAIMHYMEDSRL